MTTVLTLQPNVEALAPTFGGLTAVGAASYLAAVNDNSDASYVEGDNTGAGFWHLKFPSPYGSLPAGGYFVESLTVKLRRRSDATAFADGQNSPWWLSGIAWTGDGFGSSTALHLKSCSITDTGVLTAGAVIEDDYSIPVTYADDGSHVRSMKWSNVPGEDDEMAVILGSYGTGSGTHRLYKVSLEVRYNSFPVATIGANPPDPANSTRPIVGWTYSDADLEPQQSFRVIVVKAGTPSTKFPYGTPGNALYQPDGAVEIAWDSGTWFGAGNQIQVGPGLENGVTYFAHVRVSTVPVFGVQQNSLWGYKQFTVTATGPANPVLTVTADAANSRNRITVRESTSSTPHPARYTVERIYDPLEIFEPVRGATYTAAALGFSTPAAAVFSGWSTNDHASFAFVNGIKVRWRGTLADYTYSAEQSFATQALQTGNNRGWRFTLRTDGKLEFVWSTAGTAFDKSAVSTTSAGGVDGTEAVFEVRATLNTNPWSVEFWRSLDGGATWLQVGATVTAAGPAAMFNSTHKVGIGGYDNFLWGQLNGLTAELWVWDSAGTLVTHPVFEGQPPNTASFLDIMGRLWEFNGGSAGYLVMGLTVDDYEAPIGIPVRYETQAWRDDTDIVAGGWVASSPASVTLPATEWHLKDPLDSANNIVVKMVSIRERVSKPLTVGQPIGEGFGGRHRNATVAHTGVKGSTLEVVMRTLDKASFDRLLALYRAGRTLLLQNVHGRQWYVQAGDIDLDLVKAAPQSGEGFPIRHAYEWSGTLVEVDAPYDSTSGFA